MPAGLSRRSAGPAIAKADDDERERPDVVRVREPADHEREADGDEQRIGGAPGVVARRRRLGIGPKGLNAGSVSTRRSRTIGMSPANTHRHPKVVVINADTPGPISPGTTQELDITASIAARSCGG